MSGKTGPVTVEGKARSRTNSTRYGLRSTRILCCRREQCVYFQVCKAPARLPEKWAAQAYGDPCLLESGLIEKWRASDYKKEYFNPGNSKEREILESLIIGTVLKNRAEMALASLCGGDLFQAHVIALSHADTMEVREIKKIYSYYLRSKGRWWRAFQNAVPYIKGFIANDKFKRECDEFMKARKESKI